MSKHTPGPWTIRHDAPHVKLIRSESQHVTVALLQDEANPGQESLDALNADAHLIAAAPKLLAVAESIVLRGHASGCASVTSIDRPGARKAPCDCLLGVAAAAVAEARGC